MKNEQDFIYLLGKPGRRIVAGGLLCSDRVDNKNTLVETLIPWSNFSIILQTLGIVGDAYEALSRCSAKYKIAYKHLKLTYKVDGNPIDSEIFSKFMYAVNQSCKGQSICLLILME